MIGSSGRRFLLGLAVGLSLAGGAFAAESPGGAASSAATGQQVLVMLDMPPPHAGPNADYAGGYGDELGRNARRRVAGRIAHEAGLTVTNEWPMPLLGVDCFVMIVPDGRTADEAAASLSSKPGVAWSEPIRLYHAQGAAPTPNDPLFPVQPAAREWRLADLHQIATGRNVRVAVIDSRIEARHPDLVGQVEISEDFVPGRPGAAEAHGTGVAGVIAALADNGVGIVGVAPRARLLALRACWQETANVADTVCDNLSLARALQFAIDHDAQVINLSLGGPRDRLLGRFIDIALSRGITVVAAFDADQPDGGFPASHPGVVAVAEEPLDRALQGVYDAPGRDVPTTQPGGRWFFVSGSSYAAAHVSGLFALLRERRGLAPMAGALVSTRTDGGEIDSCASLLRTWGPCDCACARPRPEPALLR